MCNKILIWNVYIKTLKNAPTCFDLIQIIFRELICSLLKLLILKFVEILKVSVVMRQHDIWCVYVRSVWRSPAHISKAVDKNGDGLDVQRVVQVGRCLYACYTVWHKLLRACTVKANSHITCGAHAVPLPCRAAPLPYSDSAVSFVKVLVVAGNIRTASPTV